MKIALYKAETGTLIDKLINIWTGFYGYSHSEIVFDKIYGHPKDKYMCCSSSPRDGEIRFDGIDIYSRHWELIDIPEIETPQQEQEIYDFLKTLEGAKYDWKGIFLTFVFSFINKQDDKKWWCSEICGFVINKYVNENFKYRISPNKLAKKLKATKQPFKIMFSMKKSF